MSSSFDFTIDDWSIVEENKEYHTPIFDLLRRRMRLQEESGSLEGQFYVLDAPAWINIFPLTPQKEIILVEQYRYGTQEPTLEIPGGMVDEGEEPLQAARRELLEETGYRSEKWVSLGKASANPAIMTNYTHIYLAEACVFEGAENPDPHERINVHTLSLDRFLELVQDGTVHHAIVLAAVARYLLKVRPQT